MKDLLEAQKDTVLGLVNEIFVAGQFLCTTEDLVDENETIIGQATDYEKALAIAAKRKADEYNQLVNQVKDIVDEDLKIKLMCTKNTHDVIFALFLTSLRNRLGKAALEPDSIGFRKNWEIVSFNSSAEEKEGEIFIRCFGL